MKKRINMVFMNWFGFNNIFRAADKDGGSMLNREVFKD
jgi:hypothetical protein